MIHFAWMPGLSYWKSSQQTADGLPVGFSESTRNWIVWPVELAKVQRPVTVDRDLVETPLLLSDAGAAVTFLNWTGKNIGSLNVKIRIPFQVRKVESIRHGRLDYQQMDGGIEVTLPLNAADILQLKR